MACVPGVRGLLAPEQVERAIRQRDVHNPPTTLLCLEQTHNSGGGSVYPLSTIHTLSTLARAHGLALHLDGARLFNAVIAKVFRQKSMCGRLTRCHLSVKSLGGTSGIHDRG